ncbi:hypothetical protein GLI01_16360 [Gluconacetobacter liquefaciens]|uniref:Dibenzothiophene monooxygenase n=2 Tax=Gluconacetobacter liquefaciens TaxID=89584 RepID=A0A370GBF3_GLULI|nr:alkylation response protein AidB-like acyl-CoA dehydrogenase [Gluconacetobacter liquefaciens]GBR03869.1 acyl-CoA dehydrogenase [Gluconacetobacter liquefaciens NRIC 0522]GEB37601.1 hypothetical protein GLI01_16360 [Gluconacetobacter liquefaciens]
MVIYDMDQSSSGAVHAPSLEARFAPLFAEIAAGAVEREQHRELAREPVRALLDAGFGRLRVPGEAGGLGASLRESFALLRTLAAADSNIPQIVRAHFAFVEGRRQKPGASGGWFDVINDGALFGAAMAERSEETVVKTTLRETSEGWVLDGTKYYSTGTLYADWIVVWAINDTARVHAAVRADSPGVTRVDDWDGFGQRLTGSGTTIFDHVAVPAAHILDQTPLTELPAPDYLGAYYQQFHNTALAGIAQAVLRDALEFVRPRTRLFGVPGKVIQRDDPVVQGVVGRLSTLAFSTAALVDTVSDALAAAEPFWEKGETRHPAIETAQEIAFKAQQIIVEQTLEAATLLFEVGGASATSETRRYDRHWRNARVLASHNPAAQRQREIGDLALNGTRLWTPYFEGLKRQNAAAGRVTA